MVGALIGAGSERTIAKADAQKRKAWLARAQQRAACGQWHRFARVVHTLEQVTGHHTGHQRRRDGR